MGVNIAVRRDFARRWLSDMVTQFYRVTESASDISDANNRAATTIASLKCASRATQRSKSNVDTMQLLLISTELLNQAPYSTQ